MNVIRRSKGRGALVLAILLLGAPAAYAVRIVTYNVLQYGGSGREEAFRLVFFDDPDLSADCTGGLLECDPLSPHIVVLQDVLEPSAAEALVNILNTNGTPDSPGDYVMADWNDPVDTFLVYRSSIFEADTNGAGAFTTLDDGLPPDLWVNRWHLKLVGYASEEASLYVYAVHAPAGIDGTALQKRQLQALLVRADAAGLPANSRFVVAGDLEVRSDNEPSYFAYTGSISGLNAGRAFDPLNLSPDPAHPVVWHGNLLLAVTHTKSTREYGTGCPPDCGMYDRYDFQLINSLLNTPVDLSYIPGTYRAYGNDGAHFQQDIVGTNGNGAVGTAIAERLLEASDHLPVPADYQVPARIAVNTAFPTLGSPCTVTFDLGKIKQGQSNPALDENRVLNVANRLDLSEYGFVETLAYNVGLAGGLPIGPITNVQTLGGFPIADTHDAEDFNPPVNPVGNNHTMTFTIADTAPLDAFDPLAGLSITTDNDLDCSAVTVNFVGEVIPYLNVRSSPPGVLMTVTPDPDAQGTSSSSTTNYTLGYDGDTIVTLTAPAAPPAPNSDEVFLRWELDGVPDCTAVPASGTTTVTMAAAHTAEAIYGYELTVQSQPSGVAVTVTDDVSSATEDGACQTNNGTTTFSRLYDPGTTITLMAPATHAGEVFLRWEVDGVPDCTAVPASGTTTVTMAAAHTAEAIYGYELTVQSQPSVVAVTVTDDVSSATEDGACQTNNGPTTFFRRYDPGTTVTLTAPEPVDNRGFARWKVTGQTDELDPVVNIVIDSDKTALGVYKFNPDADGDIDLCDYQGFFQCLTAPGVPATPDCAADFDSDSDGDVDLADFVRFMAAFTGHSFDSNNDGHVDLTDLAGFVGCLAGPEVAVSAECAADFDADCDGDVDFTDFAGFQAACTG